jgi:integrase
MSLSRVPSYRHHKPTGQAVVTIRLADGTRKDFYLGRWNSSESRAEYARIIGEIGVAASPAMAVKTLDRELSINELILTFLRHADTHYRRADGSATQEPVEYRLTLRIVRELYGHTPAKDFGPLALKTVRQAMIDRSLCRNLVNQRIGRIKRMFNWALSEQLIPYGVIVALKSVTGLQRGRTTAPDSEPVGPVDDSTVNATLPFLTRHVRGLIRFQQLTGCRPGEACSLRRVDIDASGAVWLYRPANHKLAYRGKPRVIPLGPQVQSLLAEYPTDKDDEAIFSPARSMVETSALRSQNRKTPRYASHMERNEKKRVKSKQRPAGDCYTTLSLGRAVAKAVKRANTRRLKMAGEGNYDLIPHWHPNQLRHSHGTRVRAMFGLEAAQVSLGHSRADVTQIYAERNLALAVNVAEKLG